MERTELIVVGGGIGGAAAALRAAQYHLRTAWILGDRDTHRASRAAYVKNIDNMIGIHPGIVQTKSSALLRSDHPEAAARLAAEHLHISTLDVVANTRARIEADFAEHARLVEDRAVDADRTDGRFRVRVAGSPEFEAGSLILATGVMDRQPIVHKRKGDRDLSGIHWVYPYANQETFLYCIRCEGHLTAGRRVAVLGAGRSAAEVALMVRERYGSDVVVLTTGEPIGWSAEQARLLDLEEVRVQEGRLLDLHGADRGSTLKGFTVEGGARVEVDLAFVAMGLHRVYNDLARALGAELDESDGGEERRHVLVNHQGETSIRNLFAVGDMARRRDQPVMKQIYTAQEYAVRAVDTIDSRRRRAQRAVLLGRT